MGRGFSRGTRGQEETISPTAAKSSVRRVTSASVLPAADACNFGRRARKTRKPPSQRNRHRSRSRPRTHGRRGTRLRGARARRARVRARPLAGRDLPLGPGQRAPGALRGPGPGGRPPGAHGAVALGSALRGPGPGGRPPGAHGAVALGSALRASPASASATGPPTWRRGPLPPTCSCAPRSRGASWRTCSGCCRGDRRRFPASLDRQDRDRRPVLVSQGALEGALEKATGLLRRDQGDAARSRVPRSPERTLQPSGFTWK
jgi:hypothetical protein